MEYYDTYLQHHGILGQKWGKKNGPPYPLSESRKSKKEKQEAKKDAYKVKDDGTKETAMNSGDAELVKKYAKDMTPDELNYALRKIDLMEKLNSKTPSNEAFKKIEAATRKVDTINRAANTGLNAYNNAATISNIVFGTDLPHTSEIEKNRRSKNKSRDDDLMEYYDLDLDDVIDGDYREIYSEPKKSKKKRK